MHSHDLKNARLQLEAPPRELPCPLANEYWSNETVNGR